MRGDELLGFHPGPMDIPSEPRCLGSSRVDDAEILHFGGGQQAQSLIEGLPRVAPTLPSRKTTQHDEGRSPDDGSHGAINGEGRDPLLRPTPMAGIEVDLSEAYLQEV